MKNVIKLSESELARGGKSSWHDQYKHSAWIFVGGLPYDLTEGDVICVFSQYGEIVNINLVRDKVSGKQKGFCFICYEDQKSTILAVDNLNGIKVRVTLDLLNESVKKIDDFVHILSSILYLSWNCFAFQVLGKSLRVDHCEDYKPPKDHDKFDEETRQLHAEGCAPKPQYSADQIKREPIKGEIVDGIRLPPRLPIADTKTEDVHPKKVRLRESPRKH